MLTDKFNEFYSDLFSIITTVNATNLESVFILLNKTPNPFPGLGQMAG